MAIEIKELVVRAIVNSKSENQNQNNPVQANGADNSMLPYLESLMKSMDNKNER